MWERTWKWSGWRLLSLAVVGWCCLPTLSEVRGMDNEDPLLDLYRDPSETNPFEALTNSTEVLGAEDLHAEDDYPRIPEPMVFDLVRPLGARKGEFEINALGIIPLHRTVGISRIPDSLGIIPDGHHPEWAPEVEWAIRDNLAIEFELPFDDTTLAAYKTAAQYTFGTAFNNRYIHGVQGILLYDIEHGSWSPTLLYVGGLRIDERWSALGMLGLRTEIGGDDIAERTIRLMNLTVFYDVNNYLTVGVETNHAQTLNGNADWLIMPQFHWEITDHWMLQGGAGVNFTPNYTLPEAAVRLIRSF